MSSNSKIKILWFSNTPANGVIGIGLNNIGSGTWLRALDLELQDKVDLNIAFYHNKAIHFTVGNTKYFGIAKYQNYSEKIKFKFLERFFDYVYDNEHQGRFMNIVNLVKPDLIHLHGTENPFGCLIGKTSIPIVVSIQGLTNSVLKYYSVGLGEKYLFLRNRSIDSLKDFFFPTNFNNARKKFIKMSFIENKNLFHCKYIIGRTEWDKRCSSVLAPNSQYFHSDEIIRTDFYNNTWHYENRYKDEFVLHTTSDNVYYKGLETISDTILLLKRNGYKCIWNLAGIGENDLIVKVERKRLGKKFPEDSLRFLGKMSANELIVKMKESDCYIMTSNIENSSNSLCEAMLLGMPCIATNVGGTSSMIRDSFDGFLVQSGDSFSLVAMILKICKDESLATKLGVNAKKSASKRHSQETIVNSLIETYKKIISLTTEK
jgi:glycosyltransferase involved in cell wall biosynthesis